MPLLPCALQLDSTPQPLVGPIPQYFSVSGGGGGGSGGDCVEDSVQQVIGMMTLVLPPQLLVDIISERLMVNVPLVIVHYMLA